MNKFALSTIASVLISTSMSTFAASTTKMTVTGTTPTPSCDISSTLNDAKFDYTSELSSIKPGESLALPPKQKDNAVVIQCAAATAIAINFTDDRVSSAGQNVEAGPSVGGIGIPVYVATGAGLGTTASGSAIGGYYGWAANPIVDGAAAQWSAIPGQNGVTVFGNALMARAGENDMRYTFNRVGKSYSFPIRVSGIVNPLTASDINSGVSLDGSQTISIIYI